MALHSKHHPGLVEEPETTTTTKPKRRRTPPQRGNRDEEGEDRPQAKPSILLAGLFLLPLVLLILWAALGS